MYIVIRAWFNDVDCMAWLGYAYLDGIKAFKSKDAAEKFAATLEGNDKRFEIVVLECKEVSDEV